MCGSQRKRLCSWYSPPALTSCFLGFKLRLVLCLFSHLASLLVVHFTLALSKIPPLFIRIYLFTDEGHLDYIQLFVITAEAGTSTYRFLCEHKFTAPFTKHQGVWLAYHTVVFCTKQPMVVLFCIPTSNERVLLVHTLVAMLWGLIISTVASIFITLVTRNT